MLSFSEMDCVNVPFHEVCQRLETLEIEIKRWTAIDLQQRNQMLAVYQQLKSKVSAFWYRQKIMRWSPLRR